MRIRFSCVIKIPDIKPCISLGVSFLVDSPLYPLSIRWETLQIDIQEQFYCDCRTKQGIKIGIYMSKFNPNLAKPSTLDPVPNFWKWRTDNRNLQYYSWRKREQKRARGDYLCRVEYNILTIRKNADRPCRKEVWISIEFDSTVRSATIIS